MGPQREPSPEDVKPVITADNVLDGLPVNFFNPTGLATLASVRGDPVQFRQLSRDYWLFLRLADENLMKWLFKWFHLPILASAVRNEPDRVVRVLEGLAQDFEHHAYMRARHPPSSYGDLFLSGVYRIVTAIDPDRQNPRLDRFRQALSWDRGIVGSVRSGALERFVIPPVGAESWGVPIEVPPASTTTRPRKSRVFKSNPVGASKKKKPTKPLEQLGPAKASSRAEKVEPKEPWDESMPLPLHIVREDDNPFQVHQSRPLNQAANNLESEGFPNLHGPPFPAFDYMRHGGTSSRVLALADFRLKQAIQRGKFPKQRCQQCLSSGAKCVPRPVGLACRQCGRGNRGRCSNERPVSEQIAGDQQLLLQIEESSPAKWIAFADEMEAHRAQSAVLRQLLQRSDAAYMLSLRRLVRSAYHTLDSVALNDRLILDPYVVTTGETLNELAARLNVLHDGELSLDDDYSEFEFPPEAPTDGLIAMEGEDVEMAEPVVPDPPVVEEPAVAPGAPSLRAPSGSPPPAYSRAPSASASPRAPRPATGSLRGIVPASTPEVDLPPPSPRTPHPAGFEPGPDYSDPFDIGLGDLAAARLPAEGPRPLTLVFANPAPSTPEPEVIKAEPREEDLSHLGPSSTYKTVEIEGQEVILIEDSDDDEDGEAEADGSPAPAPAPINAEDSSEESSSESSSSSSDSSDDE
ncbi:hypothetical protein C8R43DRAFT_966345, partial [Mycena crocata]